MLVPATIGILTSAALAQRMASRHPQRRLVRGCFTLPIVRSILVLPLRGSETATLALWSRLVPPATVAIILIPALSGSDPANGTFWPGWFLMGFAVGTMLTAPVNVVQSAWPESVQGDIPGVSRSVSNPGSSLGVAIAGSVLVAATTRGNPPFLTAMIVVGAFALVGWVAALLLPRTPRQTEPAEGVTG